jgi:hypothetical protein
MYPDLALAASLTVVLASILSVPSVGEAIDLDWSAPAGCPQADDVRAQIDLHLAREAFSDTLGAVSVEGSIEPSIESSGDGWILHVRTELPSGRVQRDVTAGDCRELGQAAGLIIAVMLDPLRANERRRLDVEPAPAPAPAPVPEPAPVLGPPTPTEASATDPDPPAPTMSRARRAFDLRAAGVLELGTFDTVRGGAWLGAGIVGRRFRVDLALHWLAPRRLRPFAEAPDAGVTLQQGGATVRGCVIPTQGPLALAACLGVDAGFVRGRGIGLTTAQTTAAPWVALDLGPELQWISRRRIGVWAATDAVVNFVRPRWTVHDLGVAAQARWVGLRVLVGPAVRL